MNTTVITYTSLAVIVGVFTLFMYQLLKLWQAKKLLDKIQNEDNPLSQLRESKLSSIVEAYSRSINVSVDGEKKTNYPGSEFFNEHNVCKEYDLNLRSLDSASGTLVGLGLLGTFLGLTLGIGGFDSSNVENIQSSIKSLLGGMGTAFLTSLVGMGLSLIYTAYDKRWRNKVSRSLSNLNDKLDAAYYIDDIQLLQYQQGIMTLAIKQTIEEEVKQVIGKITYQDAEGNTASVGNAVREILVENAQQSKALKSFSTDLALELNNGFDEVLSRQMQARIIPLMENVDQTTKTIIEHIDEMATSVAKPLTQTMEQIIDELKVSMSGILDQFKSGLSEHATRELENLAASLGTATNVLDTLPKDVENVSAILNTTIEEVKNAIAEIANTSANSSATAMKQMEEKMTNATEALNNTVSAIISSIQQTMEGITDDVTSKQTDLLAIQENTTVETKRLLEVFNQGIEKLEELNENIQKTMSAFQQAQNHITGSTAHLQSITSDMKEATKMFQESQNDFTSNMGELQLSSQRNIDSVSQLLGHSGELSRTYVEQFEVIKIGLAKIFEQLQNGLTEYSNTVQATTQKYLEGYSRSLTDTTDALKSTIMQQNDVVETLAESLDKIRR